MTVEEWTSRRPINWGFVGFGWVARDFALPAVRAAGHRLRAIFDPSPVAGAAAFADNILVKDSLEALLADPLIDAVYVATPNHRHRHAVEAALAAGLPVLCEKPMAATLADAEAIALAAQCSGTLYGTAFDQRHHPAHAAMRDLLRDGRLGKVTAIRLCYACWLDSGWSATGEAPNWRIDPLAAGGGALMDLAPHGLDLVDFLLGEPITTVTAAIQTRVHDYKVDDGAMILGLTQSGVLVSLHVAYNYPETLPRRRLEVIGTDGLLVAENTMGQEAGGSLILHVAATGKPVEIHISDADASPFMRQMRAFGHAAGGTGQASFDAQRDLHTTRLLHQAYWSAALLAGSTALTSSPAVSSRETLGCR